MVFCNIGWMGRYRGKIGQPDDILNGGRYVNENGTGNEVCNFLDCDGKVYGHVETIRRGVDRRIRIERFGGIRESVSGIDVVWTATHPQERGRRIVGWYRHATLFRERQHFNRLPSKQHRIDGVDTYRIVARAQNSHLLGIDERTLSMPKGQGWMGQTPWWSPPEVAADEVRDFIQRVRNLIGAHSNAAQSGNGVGSSYDRKRNSPGASSDPYVRYVQENEIQVNPRHNLLQNRFEAFLRKTDAQAIQANIESVDLRYQDPRRGIVFVEVKPCEAANVRYAIRTAMGQLLDYRQKTDEKPKMLIVVEVEPKKDDQYLANSNGFGIAYAAKGRFKIDWPKT